MSQWPTVPLGMAIELSYGKSLPKNRRSDGGSIPVYGSNGIAGWHNEALLDGPTVIVGRKGSAGAVQFVDGPCYPIDTTYFVRPRQGFDFDIRFVFYLLRHLDLSRLKTATGVPGLTREDAYREMISVPPLPEQRHIVDILSRAEGIVRLQREAQKKAAEIIPALFLDMFGDPATNPKGWPVIRLAEALAEPPILGTMTKPSSTRGSWLDLRVANIQDGMLALNDKKWLDLPNEQVERFILRAGDIVLARAIGSLNHLGKAVVVNPDGDWTFDSHLMRVRLNSSKLLPEVFKGFLASPGGREEFLRHSRRSAVQFNINGKELREIRLPLPPYFLQQEYFNHLVNVQSIQSQQTAALQKAEATFNALLSQVFKSDVSLSSAIATEE